MSIPWAQMEHGKETNYLVVVRTNPPTQNHLAWWNGELPWYFKSCLSKNLRLSDQNPKTPKSWMRLNLIPFWSAWKRVCLTSSMWWFKWCKLLQSCFKLLRATLAWSTPSVELRSQARSSVGDVAFPGHGNKLQPARCQHSLPKAKAQHTQDANSKEPGGTHRGVWTRREGGKQFLNLLNSLKWYLHSSFIEVCDFCLRLDQSCCFRFWRRSFWFSTCPLQWLLFL